MSNYPRYYCHSCFFLKILIKEPPILVFKSASHDGSNCFFFKILIKEPPILVFKSASNDENNANHR